MSTDRQAFYDVGSILKEVEEKVNKVKKEKIDYLTFVPDGEPTLDVNIGKEIDMLKSLGIKIAVITNSSLMWRSDVREDLLKADLVSLKMDAYSDGIWHRINRPYKYLNHDEILKGILSFSEKFNGTIITETMLIDGINDGAEEVKKIAEFLSKINPSRAYVAVPTRPPAKKLIKPAGEHVINTAYQIFSDILVGKVEYLMGYEGNAFAFTGNVEEDLLSITSVHPMREEAVKEFLKKGNANWNVIDRLVEEEKIIKLMYQGNTFYMRKLPGRKI